MVTSWESTSHLVEAILGCIDVDPQEHTAAMEAGRAGREKRKDELYTGVLSDLQSEYTADQVRSVERAGKYMNHCINVVPRTANNSVLGKDTFCDMSPSHPPMHKGGLIGGRQDNYRDDLGLVAGQAYSPSSIHDNPRVKKGQETKDRSKNLTHKKAKSPQSQATTKRRTMAFMAIF
eukprot:2075157-Ditylum_brightwellii.AAC.1